MANRVLHKITKATTIRAAAGIRRRIPNATREFAGLPITNLKLRDPSVRDANFSHHSEGVFESDQHTIGGAAKVVPADGPLDFEPHKLLKRRIRIQLQSLLRQGDFQVV